MKTKTPKHKTKKQEISNIDFADAVGKSSLLRIDWKSWDTLPENGMDIWVVVRLDKGYYPFTATYHDEIIPNTDNFPETRWRQIKFHDFEMPDVFVGLYHEDKNFERLIAWGTHRGIVRLGVDCPICKQLQCIC